jgi:hypothetical protein
VKNNVITMRDRLKTDLYHMIEDHKEIVAALNNLIETAKPHNKTEEELYSLKKTQVRCKD